MGSNESIMKHSVAVLYYLVFIFVSDRPHRLVNIITVCLLFLTLSVTTSTVERGFSKLKSLATIKAQAWPLDQNKNLRDSNLL